MSSGLRRGLAARHVYSKSPIVFEALNHGLQRQRLLWAASNGPAQEVVILLFLVHILEQGNERLLLVPVWALGGCHAIFHS